MENKNRVAIYLIIFVLTLFFSCGYYENRVKPAKYKGIVTNKYYEKRGDYPRVIIDNFDGEVMLTLYKKEKSGLWDYIQKGDSILKNEGELIIYVVRDKKKKKFELTF